MRKLILSGIFVLVGCGLWWTLAHTAQCSMRKWDAKFDTVMRHSLHGLGISDTHVLSSVSEIHNDERGEWITQKVSMVLPDRKDLSDLVDSLEESGAQIQKLARQGEKVILVKRGSRIYQELSFVDAP